MLSIMPENITSRFHCTGIFSLNTMIFQDHELAAAMVIDQPLLKDDAAGSSNSVEHEIIAEIPQVSMNVGFIVNGSKCGITSKQIFLSKAGPR